MAGDRTKVKYDEVKKIMTEAANMEVNEGSLGTKVKIFGEWQQVDLVPGLIIDRLKNLGFLNGMRIELK